MPEGLSTFTLLDKFPEFCYDIPMNNIFSTTAYNLFGGILILEERSCSNTATGSRRSRSIIMI